jgi:hypothetical protein
MFNITWYNNEHKSIFDAYRMKYQNRNTVLFEDGVIDLENYRGILFFLKEAYAREQQFSECNLALNLAEKGPWGMWNRVCEWLYGIENTSIDQIEPFHDFSGEKMRNALSHSAVVNIKKVNGTSISNDNDLQRYAKENKNLLRREIISAQPKIIVCGNTFRHLKTIFDIEIDYHSDNWYYWLEIDGIGNVLILDYYHPASQYPKLLTYYGIVNIYQQALIHK